MIYLSEDAKEPLKKYLEGLDQVTLIRHTDLVYPEISAHPDIYMCSLGSRIIHGKEKEIGYRYPGDCAFNGASTGRYLIGNRKCLAPRLIQEAKQEGQTLIHVKQGYAKCSIAVIDETSIITSDRGIYSSTRDLLDVLLISESTKETPYIRLQGLSYGFIGGTCGRIGNEIVFNGRISDHPDYESIRAFIEARGLRIKEFDYPLEDIGSIIT